MKIHIYWIATFSVQLHCAPPVNAIFPLALALVSLHLCSLFSRYAHMCTNLWCRRAADPCNLHWLKAYPHPQQKHLHGALFSESSLVTPWWRGGKWDCAPLLLLHRLCNPLSALFLRIVLQLPALWQCIAVFLQSQPDLALCARRNFTKDVVGVESNICVFSNFPPAAFPTVRVCGRNRAENCVLHKSEWEISNHGTDWIF